MANFEVLVERVANVEKHPNADRLSIVTIRGYRCISAIKEDGTPRYSVGDLVVYVPEGALVPEWLLKKGFWDEKNGKGMLAGKEGNRVKAIKLRNTLSQGILYSVDPYDEYDPTEHFALRETFPDLEIVEGLNVAERLDITKWEPEIPTAMTGDVTFIGFSNCLKFDIENIKKHPTLLDGAYVYAEEKIHGTCFISGFIPNLKDDRLLDGNKFVASKGLGAKGLVMQNSETNVSNLYVKAFKEYGLPEKLTTLSEMYDNHPVYILGEVYGQGVQDLGYSAKKGSFKAFGVYIGMPQEGYWLSPKEKYEVLAKIELEWPTVLYEGPFDMDKILEVTSGLSSLDNKTIREGVVVTPAEEIDSDEIGRVILKSVSEEYLLRKGNVTEFN